MLNDVYWHADNILVVAYEGNITDSDLRQGRKPYEAMLDNSAQSEIHLIVDLRKRTGIDSSVFNFHAVKHYVSNNEKLAWIMIVEPNPPSMMKFISTLLTKSNQHAFRIEASFEDALQFLDTQIN